MKEPPKSGAAAVLGVRCRLVQRRLAVKRPPTAPVSDLSPQLGHALPHLLRALQHGFTGLKGHTARVAGVFFVPLVIETPAPAQSFMVARFLPKRSSLPYAPPIILEKAREPPHRARALG